MGDIKVPLMTDYGFGVDEGGRIIHFQADGAQQENVPHPAMETFPAKLDGRIVAGGCNGDHPADKVVVDDSETGIDGHVGLKCLKCNVGWIVRKVPAKV